MKTKEIYLKDYQTKADIKYTDFLAWSELLPDDLTLEQIDVEFVTMRMLKIFYGLGPKDTRDLKQSQFLLLIDKVKTVLGQPIPEMKNIIEMNGIKYGFIPNFADNITAGELFDLDKLQLEKDFISLTSILYRPIVGEVNHLGEYTIEEYNGFDDKFKDVTLDIVEGYMHFFYKSFLILNPTIQDVI